jgi:hypothetical protein
MTLRISLIISVYIFCLTVSAPSQQLAKRLILRDGSYQLITKYEVRGDRVHYLSAERNDWEDVPNSLVDWDATAKFEKDRAAGEPAPEAVQLDKEMAQERKDEEAKSPEVAPALRLPQDGEVLLLDTFQTQPELVELQQDNAEVNRDTKRNILRAAIDPVAGNKQIIELAGSHSKIQAHVGLPSIYVKFEQDANSSPPSAPAKSQSNSASEKNPWERFHIVRLQTSKDTRIIGSIKSTVYGKVTQQQDYVVAKIQVLSGGWAKITPSFELTTGEYAVVELMDKSELSSGMWDFGVNPYAPPNTTVLKPEAAPAPAQKRSVELQQR